MKARTKEPQYEQVMRIADENPLQTFGLMSNQAWYDDPKRIGFTLARYKFVAKMFSGMKNVLEVGCADAFGTRVVLQEVKSLTASDFDPVFVEDVKRRMSARWKFECIVHDMLAGPVPGGFDGAYALDVIEHIPKANEDRFVENMVKSLNPAGVCILGSPSIQSQLYASPPSKEGHVNCKDAGELKALMGKHFHNVFIFSMNDEVVHTGFYPMAHYLFALCCHPKSK
jgi:2-polyprenyl-3-methyl-5-hydroxy-6-metoxy-1,4-benzoquinol methylase